jgi:multiple RNA-binding domain-containing protein 1
LSFYTFWFLCCVQHRRIQGSVLDGHTLECKPSEKRISKGERSNILKESKLNNSTDSNKNTPGGLSAKLVVRNVAFQTTQTELRTLFSTFGIIKRVRIPKKMGGVHRGFAFVEFSSRQEATNAMLALSTTHLYGRHLVIEWAKEEEDNNGLNEIDNLKVLRKKAKANESIVQSQSYHKKQRVSSIEDDVPDFSDSI